MNPVNTFSTDLTIQENKLINMPTTVNECSGTNLDKLKIMGIKNTVRRVTIYTISNDEFKQYQLEPEDFDYDSEVLDIFIPHIDIKLCNSFELSWA